MSAYRITYSIQAVMEIEADGYIEATERAWSFAHDNLIVAESVGHYDVGLILDAILDAEVLAVEVDAQ